jgi:NTE family protein
MNTLLSKQPQTIIITLMLIWLSGCSSSTIIDNQSVVSQTSAVRYGLGGVHQDHLRNDEVTIVLAFSGGGARAAALAYGVMQGLRDTTFP